MSHREFTANHAPKSSLTVGVLPSVKTCPHPRWRTRYTLVIPPARDHGEACLPDGGMQQVRGSCHPRVQIDDWTFNVIPLPRGICPFTGASHGRDDIGCAFVRLIGIVWRIQVVPYKCISHIIRREIPLSFHGVVCHV